MSEQLIPVLRMNNRKNTQTFYEQTLGLKSYREENATVDMGAWGDRVVKLVLMESPSMRTRTVEGPKKLERLTLRAAHPAEIEALLARGAQYSRLFHGNNGYAFEAISPERDHILLHAEDDLSSLQAVVAPVRFSTLVDFIGLTEVTVDQLLLNTPIVDETVAYYANLLPQQNQLRFQAAEGPDLQVFAEETWDLDSFRISVSADFDWLVLADKLENEYFQDKKRRFLMTTDPNKIEIWFEK